MNAMQAIERDAFEIEAEAYCRDRIPGATAEDVLGLAASLRYRAMLEEIRPWLRIKANIYNRTLPKITIDMEDLGVTSEYHFSEAAQKTLDVCDAEIKRITERYRYRDSAGGGK